MLINKPPDAGSGTSRHPLHQVSPVATSVQEPVVKVNFTKLLSLYSGLALLSIPPSGSDCVWLDCNGKSYDSKRLSSGIAGNSSWNLATTRLPQMGGTTAQ